MSFLYEKICGSPANAQDMGKAEAAGTTGKHPQGLILALWMDEHVGNETVNDRTRVTTYPQHKEEKNMSTSEIESKVRELRQLQALIEEAGGGGEHQGRHQGRYGRF